jgi:hypothetical protein
MLSIELWREASPILKKKEEVKGKDHANDGFNRKISKV